MSRWLQANYKRKAVDATPQHENIERQWEAEQWSKELNKPAIVETVTIESAEDQIKNLIDKGLVSQAIDAINKHDYSRGSDLFKECMDKAYLNAQVQLSLYHKELPNIETIKNEAMDILSRMSQYLDKKAIDLLYSYYGNLTSTQERYYNVYSFESKVDSDVDYTDVNNMSNNELIALATAYLAYLVFIMILRKEIGK